MAFDQRASSKPLGRSRWNSNQQQLQKLESIFEQANGSTPNRARIKDIAIELIQYGQISETNVYNWFQNRKARAKRKMQHQVGRRRRLTRTTACANALKLNRKALDEAKAGDIVGTEWTSPKAKRVKSASGEEGQHGQINDQSSLISQLAPNPDFGCGSSVVENDIAGVLEADDLRSPVDFATLATDNPQLPNVEHITHDMLFSDDDHPFHEQGTVESQSGQLHKTSEEVIKAWEDVRTSFGDCGQIVHSVQGDCQISSADDTYNTFPSSLDVDEDKLASLTGNPMPRQDVAREVAPEGLAEV